MDRVPGLCGPRQIEAFERLPVETRATLAFNQHEYHDEALFDCLVGAAVGAGDAAILRDVVDEQAAAEGRDSATLLAEHLRRQIEFLFAIGDFDGVIPDVQTLSGRLRNGSDDERTYVLALVDKVWTLIRGLAVAGTLGEAVAHQRAH